MTYFTYFRVSTALQRRTSEDVAASRIELGFITKLFIRLLDHVLIEHITHISRPAVNVEMKAGVQQRTLLQHSIKPILSCVHGKTSYQQQRTRTPAEGPSQFR